MKSFKSFKSLEELNQFLTEELDLPSISEGQIPDLDKAIGFRVRVEDEADEAESKVDSYIEFSARQLELIMAQRDEARQMFEEELQAHQECHVNTLQAFKQIRAQGYAESMAAGLFPSIPFERLPEEQQKTLLKRAHASIAYIDDIRKTLAQANAAGATFQ